MNEKITSFSERLNQAMKMSNITQAELSHKTKIDKTLINKYVKGVAEAGNDNLPILAKILQVNVIWLMGYDVPSRYFDGLNEMKTDDLFNMFSIVLKKKGIIDKNESITEEDFNRIINFIKNNKELLIKK